MAEYSSEKDNVFIERRKAVTERRKTDVDRRLDLDRRRGPGRRRSNERRAAEEGQMTDEQFVFLNAIDQYKRANQRPFPTWTEVLEVIRKKDRAIVEGVNMLSKHTRPTNDTPQGGIIKKEGPVHLSNLMLVDPSGGKATRVGRRLNDKGKMVRFAKKSGEEIK